MRTNSRVRAGAAIGATLALAAALTGCTQASDYGSSGSATAGATASGSGAPSFDPNSVQAQDAIIAMLPDGALSDGVLDIGASTDYPPAEFLDAEGNAVGYDVDFAQAIARVLGVTADVHTAEFDSIISAIGSNYDAGISSFTITAEREAAMDMISYVNVGSRFNVAAGNPEGVDPSDHLNLCGLTIGVQTGTSQEESLNADSQACTTAGQAAIDVRSYSTQSEATTALTSSTIDAVYSDSTVAGYAVEQTNGAVETVGEVEDALPQGIVLSKDDAQLNSAIQAAIQYLMDEGILDDILTSWGVDDAALTTAELNPSVEG